MAKSNNHKKTTMKESISCIKKAMAEKNTNSKHENDEIQVMLMIFGP